MADSDPSVYSVYELSDYSNGIFDYAAQAVALSADPAHAAEGGRPDELQSDTKPTSTLQRPTFYAYGTYSDSTCGDSTPAGAPTSGTPTKANSTITQGGDQDTATPSQPSLFHDADLDISSLVSIVSNSALSHVRVLGSGHFGVTFRALLHEKDASQARVPVVVKVCRSQTSSGTSVGASGIAELRELAFAAKLPVHRNVVSLLGVVTDFSRARAPHLARFGIVLPLIGGGEAQEWLGGLVDEVPPALLLQIALQMALGVQHVHANGLVHLDIALRNFLIDEEVDARAPAEVRVLLSDFGLTRRLAELQRRPKELAPRVVPWPWWPLEALSKREFSFATDVWSFGASLWELFARKSQHSDGTSTTQGAQQQRRPFAEAKTPVALGKLILSGVSLADRLPSHCPVFIKDLVRSCMALDPAARPTMEAVVAVITENLGAHARALVDAARESAGETLPSTESGQSSERKARAAEAAAQPKSALSKVKSLLSALDMRSTSAKTLFKKCQQFSGRVAKRLGLTGSEATRLLKLMEDKRVVVHVTTKFGNISIAANNLCAVDFGAGWVYVLVAKASDEIEALGTSTGGGTTYFFVLRDDVCAAVLDALDQGQYEYHPPVARLADGSLPSLGTVLTQEKGSDDSIYALCKQRSEAMCRCMGLTKTRLAQLDRSGEQLTIPTGQGVFTFRARNVCGSAYGDTWTVMLVPEKVIRPGVVECGSGTTHVVVLDEIAHSLVIRAVGPQAYGNPVMEL